MNEKPVSHLRDVSQRSTLLAAGWTDGRTDTTHAQANASQRETPRYGGGGGMVAPSKCLKEAVEIQISAFGGPRHAKTDKLTLAPLGRKVAFSASCPSHGEELRLWRLGRFFFVALDDCQSLSQSIASSLKG